MAPIQKIPLVRIAHVWYKHENIEAAKKFAQDFGFAETAQIGKTTFYRGYGTDPFSLAVEASNKTEFGGAAFEVETEEDLVRASKILPAECRPTEVHEMKDVPGGGKRVTFYDPVDGFPFHLVHGQTPVAQEDPGFPCLKYNYVSSPHWSWCFWGPSTYTQQPVEKNRGVNEFQRFKKRPAPVHKLGHFGMCVTNFAKCYDFYSTYFNFHPSEVSHLVSQDLPRHLLTAAARPQRRQCRRDRLLPAGPRRRPGRPPLLLLLRGPQDACPPFVV
jgi:hypothetical protein